MLNFFRKYALHILIIFHIVGVVGILFFDKGFFAALTPLNLLLSTFLIVICHEGRGKALAVLFLATFGIGYLVELLGTQTGFPFGEYRYEEALGPKFREVPLIIGVNWFLLVIGAGFLARKLTANRKLQTLLAALIMVLVDLSIEPIAPRLNYWHWAEGSAPTVNYLGWFVVSAVMQIIFQNTVKTHTNKLAIPYIFTVSIFFIILNLGL